MTAKAHISPKHDPDGRRWCVEVSLKFEPEELDLDPGVVGDVVRVWIAATSPEAVVIERRGTPLRHVFLRNRASARRLIKVWGGRIVHKPTGGFTLSPGPGIARRLKH
jgi:hypothetical protein